MSFVVSLISIIFNATLLGTKEIFFFWNNCLWVFSMLGNVGSALKGYNMKFLEWFETV